jgi:hypothetical protein
MLTDRKTFWESVDVALTVTLKLLVLFAVLVIILTLSFCSDERVKEASSWTFGRLKIAGFSTTKISLGIIELQAAANAATGVEAGNAKGLAADLKRLAVINNVPSIVGEELVKLAVEVEGYSSQLENRDKQLLSAVKTAATAPSTDSGPVEAWVYIGRKSSIHEWAPMSENISLNINDKPTQIKIVKDAVLVGRDPSIVSTVENNKIKSEEDVVRLVRAGGDYFEILSIQESPSIGNAILQWAKIKVQPRDLYEIRRDTR